MTERKPSRSHHDLLGGVKFVKVGVYYDLEVAEALQRALREAGVGAVIINDEPFQAEPPEERADATSTEGFRIEVPANVIEKAREIIRDLQKDEE